LPLSIVAGRSGADVRITLDRLLLEQEFLTMAAMDAAANARLDELIGASSALDQSSVSLAEVVGAINGQPAAVALLEALRGETADLVGAAGGWTPAAAADLERRRAAVASQLATDDLSADTATGLLVTRDQTLLSVSASLANQDRAAAIQELESALAANDNLALPLSAALATRASELTTRTVEGRDVDLRRSINQALQERLWWATLAVTASADGRAPGAQLPLARSDDAANSLGAIVAGVWTTELGDEVAEGLRSESATLNGIAAGGDRRQLATQLDRLRSDLDSHLAATDELLPPGLLGQQLRASDQPQLTAVDGFIARDYTAAFSRALEAGRQAQKPADTLAMSIVDRFPGRYLVLRSSPAN
jgi:hypothetical protein